MDRAAVGALCVNSIVAAMMDVTMTNTMRVEATRHYRRATHRELVAAARRWEYSGDALCSPSACVRNCAWATVGGVTGFEGGQLDG